MVQPLAPSPTPPPTSGVIPSSQPTAHPMPAAGMRRLLVGWFNQLPQIYGDVITFDAARATGLHKRHAEAIKAVSMLPLVPLAPSFVPLSPVEEGWVDHVTATPSFLNSFGHRGWRVVRVSLAQLVVWQPIVDAPRDDAPAITTEEEIIKALLPEVPTTLPYRSTLSRDEKGAFHAMLTSSDPNHDFDLTVDEEGAGGVRIRLRPRANIVFATLVNGRLVVLNGYNRLARLASAGRREAPILLLEPGHAAGVIAERPGFLPLNIVVNAPRPPLVPDFLNSDVTMDVLKPAVERGHDFTFTHVELPVRR
jgi:hypothetical protein